MWVGTGEAWTRNSVSVGDGIYKSTDGGENWTNVGLKDSEHIAKILVDPKDSNTVYACAIGHLWNDNTERGVYKTSDGGKTWRKVLAGSNGSTGCGMMSMSPLEPNTIYASMWDFRRQGWTFRSGGPGSGLYKSTDGGEHWTELTDANSKGLPAKPYGRIALAVAPSKPQVVYAMIESANSALFRSDDGGKTWARMDASQFMVWRPFYFANLIVDPKDENKIFKPDLILLLSVNGGRSFSPVSSAAHGDFHTVWIDPANPNIVYAGDDGGLWRSEDGGTRWKHQMNLPVSQFYHVSVDNADPYHVYGGLQDNSSWVGDSSYPGGVSNSRWENMFNGDGFWMFEDPADPAYIYAEYQGGTIGRVNRYTHETRAITPYPEYGEKKLRFNWNAPIAMSPNEKGTIYMGAQFLFRSRDHGQSWERISPDLTTNDPEKQKQEESGGVTVDNSAAEMHTTIYSISESPKNGQIIWVGTDDGNLQITRDGGKTLDQRCRQCRRGEVLMGIHGRGQPLRRRHRLRHFRSPYLRRHAALCLQDHRLRQDLDVFAGAGQRRARICSRHHGRHRQPEHPVSRHRIRPVDLGRRRQQVGAVQRQRFPGGCGARHRRAAARIRSGAGDPWPRHLDHRRHFARCAP